MRQKTTSPILTALLALSLSPTFGWAAEIQDKYVYVAPNAIQAGDLNIFTTITMTNTTDYWFNPSIYLIDPEGEVIKQLAPLLKSFGTWQRASVDIVADDFRGSVWVVSPQPIVAAAFIHQLGNNGTLSLLGNSRLELVGSVHAEERLDPDN